EEHGSSPGLDLPCSGRVVNDHVETILEKAATGTSPEVTRPRTASAGVTPTSLRWSALTAMLGRFGAPESNS
ncbi:MAG TPA: hypothetical protein VM925_16105, partial [Labilithrix sp.]|nr:hypothetical protein [Labilithrix sp.]